MRHDLLNQRLETHIGGTVDLLPRDLLNLLDKLLHLAVHQLGYLRVVGQRAAEVVVGFEGILVHRVHGVVLCSADEPSVNVLHFRHHLLLRSIIQGHQGVVEQLMMLLGQEGTHHLVNRGDLQEQRTNNLIGRSFLECDALHTQSDLSHFGLEDCVIIVRTEVRMHHMQTHYDVLNLLAIARRVGPTVLLNLTQLIFGKGKHIHRGREEFPNAVRVFHGR
mmetsp:Transcript_61919/g.108876  ORF Transcript_61919/g.108876 Transcript_61919/m.108876 type:complete len:220 (-) Transcript_61919:983-1642(-)